MVYFSQQKEVSRQADADQEKAMEEEKAMENQREKTGWATPNEGGGSRDLWEDEESLHLGNPWKPQTERKMLPPEKRPEDPREEVQPFRREPPRSQLSGGEPPFSGPADREPSRSGPAPHPPAPENNSMSTAALVMGILSIPATCFCTVPGILFGVLGIIFSLLSRRGGRMDSQAKTGLILSIIGIILTFIMILLIIVLVVISDMTYSGF